MHLFNIQMKLQAAKQRIWYPPEGKLISDINKAWVQLEGAEHTREVALRKELQRQERLEQLAEKFNRKAGLRESWLEDMFQVLCSLALLCIRNSLVYIHNLNDVEAHCYALQVCKLIVSKYVAVSINN